MKFFITNFSMGLGNHHHLLKSHTIFKTYLLPLYLKKNSSCFQFFIFKHFPITFLNLIYRTNICCCLGWIYASNILLFGEGAAFGSPDLYIILQIVWKTFSLSGQVQNVFKSSCTNQFIHAHLLTVAGGGVTCCVRRSLKWPSSKMTL